MSNDAKSIKAIFMEALDKATPQERAAYLDKACAGDATVRARVDALLGAHGEQDPLLDRPAVGYFDAEASAAEAAPAVDLSFLTPSKRPDALGRLGHYEILEVIGRGGMGIVLRAFDEKLHRVVAIKVLAPTLGDNGAARQRFVREARATAAVTHENVIAIHDVEDTGPAPYLVMQCIDGKTLQAKLDATGPLEVAEILRIGLQVAAGLAAAHRQGLIHRDIKPANILLENGIERVKLTDFGLARAVDDASVTQSGLIAGTPLYMSPEQARGERVDYRTDLFSLGSVLYAMCTGHAPFRAEHTLAVLRRVCDDTPRPIRDINPAIPEWLESIIAQLLAKAPADRIATAAEVCTLLNRSLAQVQGGVSPSDLKLPAVTIAKDGVQPSTPPARRPRSLAWAALGLAAVAIVIAGGLALQQWFGGESHNPGGDEKKPIQYPITLKPFKTLPRHSAGVRSVAFSPNGKTLVSAGQDGSILVWDTDSWDVRGTLTGHSGDVLRLVFSPDGAKLASVTSNTDDVCIRLWDVATPKADGTLGGRNAGMWALDWSRDGKLLACAGWDREIRMWDMPSGEERPKIENVIEHHVRGLSISPKGDRIITGGRATTRVWNVKSGEQVPAAFPSGLSPTFLPSGERVAGWIYLAGRIAVCEFPSGNIKAPWRAHDKEILELAVSPDGRFLASTGYDLVRVWVAADSMEEIKEIARLEQKGDLGVAAFSPDGKRLATAGVDDWSVRIWDLPEICHVRK